jgi:hypothetical protein
MASVLAQILPWHFTKIDVVKITALLKQYLNFNPDIWMSAINWTVKVWAMNNNNNNNNNSRQ